MSASLSLARLAEWCVERSGWARRQPAFAFLWGQLISSRVEAQLKDGQAPAPSDLSRLARALEPVFSSRDEQLKRGAWLSLHCALSELIAPGEPDRFAEQTGALLDSWPASAPPPDAHGPSTPAPEHSFQNSFFCRALLRGHAQCAERMSARGMPWALPDASGALSAQLPGAILAQAQAEINEGAANGKAERARQLLLCAFAQGAGANTLMSQNRATPPLAGFPGFTHNASTPITLGALAASLGCSELLESCWARSQALREQEALGRTLPPVSNASRKGPSL